MEKSIKHPIKAVARRTGLSQHVIRMWERRYNAVVPERTETNRRRYSEEDILRLDLLRQCTEAGHSIGQIAGLPTEQLANLAAKMQAGRIDNYGAAEVDKEEDKFSAHVDLCIEATTDMDDRKLEECLIRAAVAFSRPALIGKVIQPFIEKLGELWQDGKLRIMHEHLASEVVRRHLESMIDNAMLPETAPRLVVTTPAGQIHELGALLAGAAASSCGWLVTYLGPNLPAEEIAAAIGHFRTEYLLLSIVYPPDDPKVNGELVRLRKAVGSSVSISYAP